MYCKLISKNYFTEQSRESILSEKVDTAMCNFYIIFPDEFIGSHVFHLHQNHKKMNAM